MIELGLVQPPDDGVHPRVGRRRLALVVATIVAIGLAAVGVVALLSNRQDGSGPTGTATRVSAPPGTATMSPTTPTAPTDAATTIPLSALGVSVIVDDRLVLPDGTNITVPGSTKLWSGYQTRDGWHPVPLHRNRRHPRRRLLR